MRDLPFLDHGQPATLTVVASTFDPTTGQITEATVDHAVTIIRSPIGQSVAEATGGQVLTTATTFLLRVTEWPTHAIPSNCRLTLANQSYQIHSATLAADAEVLIFHAQHLGSVTAPEPEA